MCLTSFLMFITWQRRESSITIMEEIYRDLNSSEAASFFYFIFFISFLINLFFYPYGFYSLTKKKVKCLKIYTNVALFTAITTIFLIYINMYIKLFNLLFRMFILVFVLRLILYGFSRFLANLLVSILLLPRYTSRNQNNNNNNYNTI